MRFTLSRIISEYSQAKSEAFGGHPLASFIRDRSIRTIHEFATIDSSKYKITGSPGQGNWADIPWIAIFDREITTTATKGYYIVYLFTADMSGVYLSLNQGWTYYVDTYGRKTGREKIKMITDAWKVILSSRLSDFEVDKIDLNNRNNNSNLAQGYELGHICGKYYPINNFPTDEVLLRDLYNLLGVYRELKGNMVDSSFVDTNKSLVTRAEMGLFSKDDLNSALIGIERAIHDYTQSTLIETVTPELHPSSALTQRSFTPRKTNFLKKAEAQRSLGLAGEKMVLNHEKNYLNSQGQSKLASMVKHVSEEDGDGAGYDILSFELDGTEKYIEVKTTTGSDDTPFIISDNELVFSTHFSNQYYLYRIYEFDIDTNTGKFYKIHGNLNEVFSFKALTYTTNGFLNSEETE